KFVVKLSKMGSNNCSIKHKYHVLSQLHGVSGIPQPVWFGSESGCSALVLSYLGPSLEDVFGICGQTFTLGMVCRIARQLICSLTHLKCIHLHNFIHCNIKPTNILVGDSTQKDMLHLADFSVTHRYWDTNTHIHIPFHEGLPFIGTPAFTSLQATPPDKLLASMFST
ncbi:kinase-like protein, partial [Imleria badia]